MSQLSDTELLDLQNEGLDIAGQLGVFYPTLNIGIDVIKPKKMPDPNHRDWQGRPLDILAIEEDLQKKLIVPDYHIYRPSHSWTRNMYNLLCLGQLVLAGSGASFADGTINFKDEGGTVRNLTTGMYNGAFAGYTAAYGNTTSGGIRVGNTNTAESFQDFAMISTIAHGSAATQLRYWDMWAPVKSYNAGTRVWTQTITRYFTNHSGGSITVYEVGLVFQVGFGSAYFCLVARDVPTPVTVNNLELLRVVYLITSAAFPS